ncbi:flavin reductase family protein, partial [Ruminococcus sp.]|uniref:flavin reductase family protein n=1 Tax=Ruminococcus sp. TaxID=41978 RepID=UPI0038687C82
MRKNFGAKPYLYPQPVMIIATYDENGKANAMNAAWGGIVGSNEIMIDLGSHKTTENMLKTKAFTVSVADVKNVVACDYVGVVSGNNEPDKMKKAGFTTTKSEFVNAPVINELPLALECVLTKVIDESKYLGEIKNVSIDESVLDDNGELDLSKFIPITYDPVFHG